MGVGAVSWTFGRGLAGAAFVMLAAIIGSFQFAHRSVAPTEPFAALTRAAGLKLGASLNAFGASRPGRQRLALPARTVEFPVEVSGDPSSLTYQWVPANDTLAQGEARPVNGAGFVAPVNPGFYRLAISRGVTRQIIGEPALVVMVPFEQKVGARLNGYNIGTYIAERLGHHDHPEGFVQVDERDLDLKVSKHLRLGDFITHDQQADVWPKYVALNPRLLDKLELVLARVGSGARANVAIDAAREDLQTDVAFDVHSGFRTPAHNGGVWRAARDSRHQYGDAADVAIDADGDGRVTLRDELIVARAVEQVEAEHPDLVGGLGLYTSRHYRTPYVHIDARGKRSRWTG